MSTARGDLATATAPSEIEESVCARGRPRSEAVRCAILRAANELFDERGFKATTIEAIAKRAGASKVTLYRWWPNKAAIVMDAFLAATSPKFTVKTTESALSDLRAQMVDVTRVFRGRSGILLAGLAAEGVLDAEVGRAFREHWVKPRRADAKKLLRRCVQSGEMIGDLDLELVLDALFGPIYYRLMVRHEPMTKAFAEGLWATVIRGIATPAARIASIA